MKKLFAILLVFTLLTLLCSCSSSSNDNSDTQITSQTTTEKLTETTTETTTVIDEEKSVESSNEWITLTDSYGLEHPCLNISSDAFLERVKEFDTLNALHFSYYKTDSYNGATLNIYQCDYTPPQLTNYTFAYIISSYKNTIDNASFQGTYDAILNEEYGAYVEMIVATIYAFSNGEIDKSVCAANVYNSLKEAISSRQSFYYKDFAVNIHYNNDNLLINIYKTK